MKEQSQESHLKDFWIDKKIAIHCQYKKQQKRSTKLLLSSKKKLEVLNRAMRKQNWMWQGKQLYEETEKRRAHEARTGNSCREEEGGDQVQEKAGRERREQKERRLVCQVETKVDDEGRSA